MSPQKIITIFCLILTLITVTQSALGFFTRDKIDEDIIQCVSKRGIDYFVALSQTDLQHQGQLLIATSNLALAKKYNIRSDLLLYINPQEEQTEQIDRVMINVPMYLYGMIWINFNANGWKDKNDYDGHCRYLKVMLNYAKSYGKQVGIMTSANSWQIWQSDKCNDLSGVLLWYYNGTFQQNFNDFVPFGSWTKPSLKVVAPTQCNVWIPTTYRL